MKKQIVKIVLLGAQLVVQVFLVIHARMDFGLIKEYAHNALKIVNYALMEIRALIVVQNFILLEIFADNAYLMNT